MCSSDLRRIRRHRGLPRLWREVCNYHPLPLRLPLSDEGWLLRPPVLNLAGGVVFGTLWGVIISGAGISILAVVGFRAAPLTPVLGLFLGGVILRCSFAIPILWDIHHVYVI